MRSKRDELVDGSGGTKRARRGKKEKEHQGGEAAEQTSRST